MFIAVFRRWFNLIFTAYTRAKGGQNISSSRCEEASYSIAKQAVRMIGTMYPPHLERSKK